MSTMQIPFRCSAPLVLLLAGPALASQGGDGHDWPQWRGPTRTGVSAEASWSPNGKAEPLWSKDLGLGHSSFAVVGERVYTMGYDQESGLDSVFCLSAASGEELWSHSYPAEIWDTAHDGGTLTTPTVDAGVVFTSNREGKVFCFDAESGDVQWSRDLRVEKELEPHTWGFSASPLLLGDLVVMNVGKLVALDRRSGEDRWVTERNYGIAYATPAAFELEGKEYLASLSGDGLAVLSAADGAELAFHDWVKRPQIYPMTPVVIGDRIFISGGYDRGCAMLQFTGDGLVELWASRVMRNKMSGCVLWGDHLYGFDESILKCIDLDGKMRWRQRGLGTGSMTIAGGRLLILDGKGQVIVAEANPEEYVELSRQPVLEGGTAWSTPILSHGRVYCRSSLGAMACLDYSAGAEPGALAMEAGAEAGLPAEGELPSAESLVARHVQGMGGAGAFEELRTLHMSGTGTSLLNTVQAGAIELDWAPGQGFSWREEGGFQLAFNARAGWQLGGNSGVELLEDEPLHALQEAGNLERLMQPARAYSELRTSGRKVFDNRDCYAVEAKTSRGYARTLYFEVESGMLAGHQGEGISMWTLASYRDFDGYTLPSVWAIYEPVRGEMNSAVFSSVTINSPQETDPFEPPPLVQLYLRTPEQVAADNVRLTELHAAILGEWMSDDREPDDPNVAFLVQDGFLMFDQPERGTEPMGEPGEDGTLFLLAADYVTFVPETNEAGEVVAFQVQVAGDDRTRLVRAAEDD